MKYSDFIEVNEGFQTSINLEYDLNKIEKVRSYIPTEQSVKILGAFLRSFYFNNESQNRATVLIGPYGRGKSHLLLVLTALTSMDSFGSYDYTIKQAKETQLELCQKIERIDPEVGALALSVVESNIRALPVIINSNTTDINQAFLIAIKSALEKAGLEELLPNTYFDAAIEVIDKWRTEYPQVVKKIATELKKNKKTLESLYTGLKQFDQDSYYDFCEIYPLVAAGTTFNPLSNMDVVKLYLAVVDALCEQSEYTGINIIFDEFSKFLEANLDASKMLNFKIIQDMAEASTRSGKKQIHFTCITHKDILDYSSSDSFKTVEGRFNKIRYIASSEQSYELIANAVFKKPAFKAFCSANESLMQNLISVASVVNVFDEMETESFEKKVVEGCFPLAPLSAFALLHISELVGQNERTLFTFLAKNDRHSLLEFILTERPSPNCATIELIYDYFQDLLRKEVFNASVHSVWAKTDTALRQVRESSEKKVLKAIAIISMIQDERFKAIPSHIKAALMMEDEVFSGAVAQLQKKHIISQRDSSEFVLLTANGVDVQKNVENYVNSRVSKVECCDILEASFAQGYVIPREYNDRYGMLRFFKRVFMDASTLLAYTSGEQLLRDYPYDGLIINVLALGEKKDLVLSHLVSFRDTPEIIVCLSSFEYEYEAQLKKYVAIQHLKKSDYAKDPHYLEEIEYYEEDLAKQIRSAIVMSYSENSRYSEYYSSEGKLDIFRLTDLNQHVSSVCLARYEFTPVINNEMVNKRVLNAQNLKGRNLAIDWVLKHSEDLEIPCMEGYGPEVSVFRSAFAFTGLAKTERVDDPGICRVIGEIRRFIEASENNKNSFGTLYTVLEQPPYGLRKGVIPLFVAYVMRHYKETATIYYKNKEVELSAGILSSINDAPDDYMLLIEAGTQEREEYLSTLSTLFAQYEDSSSLGTSRVFAIVKSMQTWMRSLPDYTKKYTRYDYNGTVVRVDNSTKIVRNDLLKFEVNAHEMLFERWREKLSTTNDYLECAAEICRVKELLDMHIFDFRKCVIDYLTALFVPGYTGSLSKALKIWYEKLPESTKHHVFDSDANSFMVLAEKWESYDDQKLLNELAIMIVSMAIEDWTDQLSDTFKQTVSAIVERINAFVESDDTVRDGKLLISLPGIHVEKSFSDAEISPLGQTALSNLKAVFEEYNDAIEPDEQLAIIAKLIGDIIR